MVGVAQDFGPVVAFFVGTSLPVSHLLSLGTSSVVARAAAHGMNSAASMVDSPSGTADVPELYRTTNCTVSIIDVGSVSLGIVERRLLFPCGKVRG